MYERVWKTLLEKKLGCRMGVVACCSVSDICSIKGLNVKVFTEQADLSKPETIPATLVGIHTIIDCATGRPEEPIKTVSYFFNIDVFMSSCIL